LVVDTVSFHPLFAIQKKGDIAGLVAPDLGFGSDESLHLTSHIGAFATAIAQRFKKDVVKGASPAYHTPYRRRGSNRYCSAKICRN
jgi:hypothetical protein